MSGELPKGWCECRYGDVGYLQNGYAFSSQQYTKEGSNLIRISDIQNGRINCKDCVKIKEDVDKNFIVQKNDLLLAMSGATTGKTGVYKENEVAFLNQRVGNLKVYSTDAVCLKFRNYFFENKKKEIEHLAYGGAQPNISKSMIENLSILLPPLAEQERIVEKIEELFSEIDESIKNLKTAQLQLKQYRQSILKSAFEGKLYKTTEWKELKYKDIGYLQNGYAFNSKQYTQIGINLIRISDIQNGKIDCRDCVKVNQNVDESFVIKKNDLLLAMSGATTGKIGVYEETEPAFLNQRVGNLKIYSTDMVNLKFRNYFFENQKKEIERLAYGGAQPNISKSMIENLSVFLPSLPEQECIVEEIEKRFEVADEMEKAVNKSLDNAQKLKQSILKKAFSGQLIPQNPDDEPASALLEHIKAKLKK